MGSNRSLDDFLGGDESDPSDADADSNADVDSATSGGEGRDRDHATDDRGDGGDDATSDVAAEADVDEAVDGADLDEAVEEDADPVASTYRWDPGGVECAACGGRVEQRWRDDGQWVCADCKTW